MLTAKILDFGELVHMCDITYQRHFPMLDFVHVIRINTVILMLFLQQLYYAFNADAIV